MILITTLGHRKRLNPKRIAGTEAKENASHHLKYFLTMSKQKLSAFTILKVVSPFPTAMFGNLKSSLLLNFWSGP